MRTDRESVEREADTPQSPGLVNLHQQQTRTPRFEEPSFSPSSAPLLLSATQAGTFRWTHKVRMSEISVNDHLEGILSDFEGECSIPVLEKLGDLILGVGLLPG